MKIMFLRKQKRIDEAFKLYNELPEEELSSVQKSNLVSALAPYKVSSVTPVIVDAETTFIILNVTAQYNKNATTSSPSELEAKILTTLTDYNDTTLQDFNNPFRHSLVTRLIDQSDTSILNSTATVTMGKLFTPNIGIEQSYSINFNNRIYHPHSNHAADMGGVISSTGFQLNEGSSFTENDEGVTREYFFDDGGSKREIFCSSSRGLSKRAWSGYNKSSS